MNKFDLLFFQINTFIEKIKQINSKIQVNEKPGYKLEDKDFIETNEKYNQKNTINNFYKIYNEEKERYLNFNLKKNKILLEMSMSNNLEFKVNSEIEILKKTIYNFFKYIFFYIFIIRIFNVASDFLGPLLLGKLLGLTTNSEKNLENSEKIYCYFYILLFILSSLTRIFTSMIYNYNLNLIRNQIDIIVNDLIFKKILILGKKSNRSEAKITKFLNDDVSTFFCYFINLNRAWELPIEIILAIYGTYKQVSLAFLPGLLFAIILLYINYRIAISITSTNEDLYKVRLERQEFEILALKNIKSIKFESMEEFFLQKIFGSRNKEYNLLTFKKYLDALCCYLWAASPVLISFFSIFSYILTGNLIDAEKVFTTISLLNMTIHPMNVFPWIFADFKDAKRVYQKFVRYLKKGKQSISNIENNYVTKIENNYDTNFTKKFSKNILLNLTDIKIKYNKIPNSIQTDKNNTNFKQSSLTKQTFNDNGNHINENFDLTIEEENKLVVEKHELIVIYGNNASGKSLLLKSIIDYCQDENILNNSSHSETLILTLYKDSLNESILNISNNEGQVFVKNPNISYVSQELWTFSASIFENITFNQCLSDVKNYGKHLNSNLHFNHSRDFDIFYEILEKCEMMSDIKSFPDRERKIIDSKGSNISGGQKQRINIARAAFNSTSELFLLDNCLSSIDLNIANLIFNNLFQKLKNEGKGIILVTSDKKWLKNADKIYFIENNKLIKKDKLDFNNFTETKNQISNKLEDTKDEIHVPSTLKENDNEIKERDIDIKKGSEISKFPKIIDLEDNNNIISISNKTLVFFFAKAGYFMFLTTILFLTFMQLGRNFIELFLADWLKNDKVHLDKKFEMQRTYMKYYLFYVLMHTIATIGRSAFFAINFLNGAKKIYELTIERFIFSKIRFFKKYNIGYLTNL